MHRRRRRPRGRFGELRRRFFLQRDDGDVVPGAARGVEHEEWKAAVAGYETKTHRPWSLVPGPSSVPGPWSTAGPWLSDDERRTTDGYRTTDTGRRTVTIPR